MVRYDGIFALTPKASEQLRGGRTTLSSTELDLLVRVDGVLTLGAIRAGMKPPVPGDMDEAVLRLIRDGYLARRLDDPFSDQFEWIPPTGTSSPEAIAESDAATASLERAGYFVRIARPRSGTRRTSSAPPLALVVEDDPHLSSFLSQYLRLEGFQTRTAGNRAEVVSELRKAPAPDLILLDVVLPDLDGFDLLVRIRQYPQLQQVPIIMLTAKATREAVLRGLNGGADGYVTKPFEADKLVEAVRTVMRSTEGTPDGGWSIAG
jgi:two-component system OmpR family response regulator